MYRGSQGGAVGYLPYFHPSGRGTTPARGNQQKNMIKKPPSVP